MSGTSAGSALSRRRFLRPSLGCVLLLAGLPQVAGATGPIVELKFESGASSSPINTGSAGGSAILSATTPTYSTNIPTNGGGYALDMGNANGNYYADMTNANVLNAIKNLKSFTITGWVNSRSATTSFGGSRIVSWNKAASGFGGVDLAFRSDGSLGLGVDTWNDQGGVTSNPAKISVDANASPNNWRFFAVSYNGTVSTENVKFYFGSNTVPASLDRVADLNQGAVAGSTDTLTIGNVGRWLRGGPFHATFRGLIDQVRIYGSSSNTSGVLNLDQIQSLQQATSLVNVPGILYEQWNNIAGTSVSDLRNDPRFPYNPSLTKLQPNFEGFTNTGDNLGVRLSGWIKAPTTGSYTFWVVADDKAELSLSTDVNPDNKRVIASVSNYNSAQDQWEQYAGQRSEPVTLEANQYYYIEALMKEGGGGDFVRVGWQLPAGTLERPIPQARMMTTPPDGVPFYPSVYPLYEAGTFIKKAAMGWEKAAGNDHFYIKTDETKALIARNGTAIFPERLFFGGQHLNDPNQNDLGFRWDRPNLGDIGKLHLETQGGRWAMRVESGSEMEPHVEFNRFISLTGPDYVEPFGAVWNGSGSIHHVQGATFLRSLELPNSGDHYNQSSAFNGGGLTLLRDWYEGGFLQAETTSVSAGNVIVKAKDPYGSSSGTGGLTPFGLYFEKVDNGAVQSSSILNSETLDINSVHARAVHAESLHATVLVTTPKWRVATNLPDYVFEKDYKLRSLEETERFVRERKHLPEIPSAKEMSAKGIDLADMNMKLLKKVEELTLHMIALDKELKVQQRDNRQLKRDMHALQGAGKGN